jgi:hypothetical protein
MARDLSENNSQKSVHKKSRVRHVHAYISCLDDLSAAGAWIVAHTVDAWNRRDKFWPSVRSLARMARCSAATVYRTLPTLEGKYLQIERTPGGRNIYRPSEYLIRILGLKRVEA